MTTRRRLPFTQFDVFTSRALEGNPLAVFPDGRSLNDDEMQAIAKEMNLSETTYILPRDSATEKERGIRVRIFTVQEELPFAGHPTLGTAFALRGNGGAAEIRLELNVGTIPVTFEDRPGQPAFGEMRQKDPVFGQIHDVKKIAEVKAVGGDSALGGDDFDRSSLHHSPAARAGTDSAAGNESDAFGGVSQRIGWKILLLRVPRNRWSRGAFARPHAFLQRRRSRHRLSFRLRRSVDGAARNC